MNNPAPELDWRRKKPLLADFSAELSMPESTFAGHGLRTEIEQDLKRVVGERYEPEGFAIRLNLPKRAGQTDWTITARKGVLAGVKVRCAFPPSNRRNVQIRVTRESSFSAKVWGVAAALAAVPVIPLMLQDDYIGGVWLRAAGYFALCYVPLALVAWLVSRTAMSFSSERTKRGDCVSLGESIMGALRDAARREQDATPEASEEEDPQVEPMVWWFEATDAARVAGVPADLMAFPLRYPQGGLLACLVRVCTDLNAPDWFANTFDLEDPSALLMIESWIERAECYVVVVDETTREEVTVVAPFDAEALVEAVAALRDHNSLLDEVNMDAAADAYARDYQDTIERVSDPEAMLWELHDRYSSG